DCATTSRKCRHRRPFRRLGHEMGRLTLPKGGPQLADKTAMGGAHRDVRGATAALVAAIAVLACALGAGGATAWTPAPSARRLPRPLRLNEPRVAPELSKVPGHVHLIITLQAQPVLAAAGRSAR